MTGLTRILPADNFVGDTLLDVGDGILLVERWCSLGLSYRGRSPNGTLFNISGIRLRKTAQWIINQCFFGSCEEGIEMLVNSTVGLISQNIVGSNNVIGIVCDNASSVRIIDNDIQEGRVGSGSGSHAIDMRRAGSKMMIMDNRINNWEDTGILINLFGATGDEELGVKCEGNHIEDTVGGILVNEDGWVSIHSNTILNGKVLAGDVAAAGITSAGSAEDISICNNIIACKRDIPLTTARFNNGISVNSARATVNGNMIRNVRDSGILLNNVVDSIVVGNNIADVRAVPAQLDGIREGGTANNNIIVANQIKGTVTPFTLIGAATLVYANKGFNRMDIRDTSAGLETFLTGSVTWDPGSIADAAVVSTTVTVTGAQITDFALAVFDSVTGIDVLISAFVQSGNTVRVVLMNKTGAPLDLASGTLSVSVFVPL
ncbi:right-handed parallel beta-helix repeat-containing protein [Candidatus Poribacteria bacterium]|nr:right-handed parallel beta-helix repeat-containing protein [Candidatus Poribacteria bacterium]